MQWLFAAIPGKYIVKKREYLIQEPFTDGFKEEFGYQGQRALMEINKGSPIIPINSNGVILIPHFLKALEPSIGTSSVQGNVLQPTHGNKRSRYAARAILEGIALETCRKCGINPIPGRESFPYCSLAGGMTKFCIYSTTIQANALDMKIEKVR